MSNLRRLAILILCLLSMSCRTQTERTVTIGSKIFTESVVLAEVVKDLALEADVQAIHRAELGGTQILWQALLNGDIDMYVEYTGTIEAEILQTQLKAETNTDPLQQIRAALAKQRIFVSNRIGFNNTYAIGMQKNKAEELRVKTLSDLATHPDLRLGLSDEFIQRKDGWYALAERYQLKNLDIKTLNHSLAYSGLASDSIDLIDLYTTDAEIELYDILILQDDLNFFPVYDAVLLARRETFDRFPEVQASVLQIEGLIDETQMANMSADVLIGHHRESEVAREFLIEKGLMNADTPTEEFSDWGIILERLYKTTAEHLILVSVSLVLAVLVAIPLGILAFRVPAFATVIIGTVDVIQTLPSLALLVLMIPLFGLGAIPTIIALFLYSLLPIVRNTYAGMSQIPRSLQESAIVLGLSDGFRLTNVELPLALPMIMTGIKTSAVINIGTATIGALIGAGGYGAPILTGIRLNSLSLIMQGAIPAATLALLVQFAFSKIEKIIES